MSEEQTLDRSVLERKERDELHTIAEALGVKAGSRTKKADLIDHILRAAGYEVPAREVEADADKPRRRTRRNGSAEAADAGAAATDEPDGTGPAGEAGAANGASTNGHPGDEAGPSPADPAAPAVVSAEVAAPVEAASPEAPAAGGESSARDGTNGRAVGDAGGDVARATGDDSTGAGSGSAREGRGRDGGSRTERSGDAQNREGQNRESQNREGQNRDSQGQNRDGQSRDGQSRDGQSRDGQNRDGQNRDGQSRDSQNRDGQSRDNQSRDNQSRDGQNRDGRQRGQGGGAPQPGPGNQQGFDDGGGRRSRRRRGRDRATERDIQNQERGANEYQYQGDPVPVAGMLELTDQGFGFVRVNGWQPTPNDVYVSVSQARRFALRKGDTIEGTCRPAMGNEKYGAMLRIDTVSGLDVEAAKQRPRFEDLTPLFPDNKLRMELPGNPANVTARIIDLISPIGKGQRGLIVSPPKAGKTTVMKHIASSIEANNPDVHLMVLLVDERPEEVTDMRRTVRGEVWASTFDRPADEHISVAELAIERAKRLVELNRDVVIILDGITRLTRAYNLAGPTTGRLNQGGIDQGAMYPPKKFFGAARNLEEGGSLTILATALVETGSKGDEVIFEEFKGTGNMELRLDRRLAERRIFPAIDVNASSTRHEELLFDRRQLEIVWRLRRVLNGLAEDGTPAKSLELLMEKIKTTRSNEEFLAEIAKAQTV